MWLSFHSLCLVFVIKGMHTTVVTMQELHNRTEEKGELDLDDLEPGSMLEVCDIFWQLCRFSLLVRITLLSCFRHSPFLAICVR